MPKYKYIGKEAQNLAGVGPITEGDVIDVTTEQASGLERHAPEQFEVYVPPAVKPAQKSEEKK